MTARTAATGISFRVATEADVPALVGLVESAYRGDTSRVGWTTEADLLDGQRTDPDEVRTVIGAPDSLLLVAERGAELLACCQLERLPDAAAAYFGMFAVRPTRQGTGVGRRVLAEAERRARADWGASQLRMKVISARDDLIAWYQRRGYRRTGQLSPFPYGDERFGIPLRSDLRFELLVKDLTGSAA